MKILNHFDFTVLYSVCSAIYFCTYAEFKRVFAAELSGGAPAGPLVHMLSASCASLITHTVMNPVWFVKTRLQLAQQLTGCEPKPSPSLPRPPCSWPWPWPWPWPSPPPPPAPALSDRYAALSSLASFSYFYFEADSLALWSCKVLHTTSHPNLFN